MVLLLQMAWRGYQILFEEWADPRTKNWFLVAKPYQIITILSIFLMFVLKWGPQWMKNRPAFNLERIMIAYNALQVLFCAYLFTTGLSCAWGSSYKLICEPVDFSYHPKPIFIAKLVYSYFLLKVFDLLDTVFFVLRKKFNQVSFLHVYHHAGMVALSWGAITYFPGGHGTLVGVINSFVHVIMYSYYLLTVAKPEVKQSIWWKKYITQLQIVQFFILVLHMSTVIFKPDCAYPRWISAVFLPQNLFMLILFLDFYIKTYVRKPKVNGVNGLEINVYSKNQNNTGGTNGFLSTKLINKAE